MAKQPIDFLFSPYRRKVLSLLFMRPDEHYHVRELARLTGIAAGSLHRELNAMAQAGLLIRDQRGNQVLYQADRSCSIFEELASIFRKTIGLAHLLEGALSPLAEKIDIALVFGSMATGLQHARSDLDVLVLGDVELLEVVNALASLQDVLKRDINPVVMRSEQFADQLNRRDRFATRVYEEPKIFVIGDDDEFGKLAKNRTT